MLTLVLYFSELGVAEKSNSILIKIKLQKNGIFILFDCNKIRHFMS